MKFMARPFLRQWMSEPYFQWRYYNTIPVQRHGLSGPSAPRRSSAADDRVNIHRDTVAFAFFPFNLFIEVRSKSVTGVRVMEKALSSAALVGD
jgi:hypothetical protein